MSTSFTPGAGNRRGYTLVELLLVVGLLGLAASLLIPNIVGRDSMRAQAAVRRLVADMTFAQADALARQELRRVEFFDDGSGYGLARVTEADYALALDPALADWIRDPLSPPGTLGEYVVRFDADSRFTGVRILDVQIDGENGFVVYDEMGGTVREGGLPGLGGTIDIGVNDDVYRVSIAAFTGKITVSRIDP
ncbi:MAG: prepilin-type N-terminal cleavage/methylation domain-containing protein [Phycisphaeraceae bacterium]|nr:prepilin-type N-terminal cleavage/methylation domain-containing protein [Phycisphaeraceae bacterium]